MEVVPYLVIDDIGDMCTTRWVFFYNQQKV